MVDRQSSDKENFLYPLAKYQGNFTPENLAFNSNLQEFAQKVSHLCNLESNGKISPEETYDCIRDFFLALKRSKENLLTEENSSDQE